MVRDPVQRLLSHYHYMIQTSRYTGSLESFIIDPRYQNVQSRAFGKYPVEAVGFVGLTEKYNESLAIINRIYSLSIPVKFKNKNIEKRDVLYAAEQELITLIKAHNQADFELYNKVQRLFLTQEKALQEGNDYVYGKLDEFNEHEISGWAINPKSQAPVKVDIFINDQAVAQLAADLPRQDFKRLTVHRNAEVGFRYVPGKKIGPEDRIEVRVADTKQSLTI
jgi:hypothetical protein